MNKWLLIGCLLMTTESFACTTSGTTKYYQAVYDDITYYCTANKDWASTMWCSSSDDCGGILENQNECYSYGPIFGSDECLSTDAVYAQVSSDVQLSIAHNKEKYLGLSAIVNNQALQPGDVGH